MKLNIFSLLCLIVLGIIKYCDGQFNYPIESYQNCTPEQRLAISCGFHANCVIIGGQPGCACIVDPVTNLGLTGNPYEGCTYDVSGVWQLYVAPDKLTGLSRPIISPLSNEPFMIRLDRTDAVMKANYIYAAVFTVTALTSFAVGICNKAYLDVDDNYSMIFETAQGYTANNGRNMILRTPRMDTSLQKDKSITLFNSADLTGEWRKEDGSKVKIFPAMSPLDKTGFWSYVAHKYNAFSYHDDSFAVTSVNDVMGIWIDRTDDPMAEQYGISGGNSYFVQTGFFGVLRFGSRRIDIFSMKKGKAVMSLFQLDPSVLPQFATMTSTPVYQSVAYKMSVETNDKLSRVYGSNYLNDNVLSTNSVYITTDGLIQDDGDDTPQNITPAFNPFSNNNENYSTNNLKSQNTQAITTNNNGSSIISKFASLFSSFGSSQTQQQQNNYQVVKPPQAPMILPNPNNIINTSNVQINESTAPNSSTLDNILRGSIFGLI